MKVHLGILRNNPIVEFFRAANEAWQKFWFEPADPLMLGLIRLLTGWMLFYNLLVWTLDLEAFFGDHGLQPLAAVRRIHESRMIFSFWLWLGDAWLWPIHFTCLAVSGLFCLGVATRVTSILSFLITISYSQRVPIANFGFDQILGMLCLYLSLGPSGAAVSVDSWFRRWRLRRQNLQLAPAKFASARMAMRLIQLHLCAIYFWAGFAKLKGPSWWTGEAMWRVIANQEYQTMDLTWMAWVPWLPYLIAHVTIAWEVFFIVLIWNPRLRPFMLLMGLGMHIGIGAFLGMWTFGLIMAFAYLAFSDPDVWRHRILSFQQRFSKTPSVQLAPSVELSPDVLMTAAEEAASDETAAAFSTHAYEVPLITPLTPVDINPSSLAVADASDETHITSPKAMTLETSEVICVVSKNSRDRASIRRYFRDHNIACRAVNDLNSGLDALSRFRFSEVLVNGAQIPTAEITDFVADVADLTGLPTLVILAKHQTSAVAELKKVPGCDWLLLPITLKSIRMSLRSVKHESPTRQKHDDNRQSDDDDDFSEENSP